MRLQALVYHPPKVQNRSAAEMARPDLEIEVGRSHDGNVELPGHWPLTTERNVQSPGAEPVPLSKSV